MDQSCCRYWENETERDRGPLSAHIDLLSNDHTCYTLVSLIDIHPLCVCVDVCASGTLMFRSLAHGSQTIDSVTISQSTRPRKPADRTHTDMSMAQTGRQRLKGHAESEQRRDVQPRQRSRRWGVDARSSERGKGCRGWSSGRESKQKQTWKLNRDTQRSWFHFSVWFLILGDHSTDTTVWVGLSTLAATYDFHYLLISIHGHLYIIYILYIIFIATYHTKNLKLFNLKWYKTKKHRTLTNLRSWNLKILYMLVVWC